MRRKKVKEFYGIIITIILLIVLVVISNLNKEEISGIENVFSKLVMPIQNGLTYIKNSMAGNESFYSDINNLQEENKALRIKTKELEEEIRKLELVKAENASLKEYMKMTEKYTSFNTIPADIINRDTSNLSRTLVINVGSKDGVKENMTVIAQEGLVGHIISVTDHTSKVLTIIDSASTVSGVVSTSRDGILLRGTLEDRRTLKASFIPAEATLVQGDNVETSGMGGIYEKGIHIGTIEEIVSTKNITSRYANVKTAVDFDKIETVLVIKKGE